MEVMPGRRWTAVRGLLGGDVVDACCAVVPGTSYPRFLRSAFRNVVFRREPVQSTADSVLPGRSPRESSPLYFGGPGGEAPWSDHRDRYERRAGQLAWANQGM